MWMESQSTIRDLSSPTTEIVIPVPLMECHVTFTFFSGIEQPKKGKSKRQMSRFRRGLCIFVYMDGH